MPLHKFRPMLLPGGGSSHFTGHCGWLLTVAAYLPLHWLVLHDQTVVLFHIVTAQPTERLVGKLGGPKVHRSKESYLTSQDTPA